MKTRFLYLLLVPVLALVLLLVGCVPTASTGGGTTLQSLQADLNGVSDKVTTMWNQWDSLKAEVTAAGNVSQSLANIQASITSMQTDVASIKTDMAALTVRVAALEAKSSGGGGGSGTKVDPKDAVKCSATFNNAYTIAIAPAATKDITVNIKLKLENKLAVDIENIVVDAAVMLYPDVSSPITINSGQFVGDIDWQPVYLMTWQNFESWSDLELAASDSDSYVLTYKANITNSGAVAISSLIVTARFECTDYDVVK